MGDLLGSALLGCSCQLLGSTSTDLFGSTNGLLGTDDGPFSSPHLGLFRGPIGRIRGASSSDDLCGGACILGGPGDHHDAFTCTSSCADHHDACTCTSIHCGSGDDLCGGACIFGSPGSADHHDACSCTSSGLLGTDDDPFSSPHVCLFRGPIGRLRGASIQPHGGLFRGPIARLRGASIHCGSTHDLCGGACILGGPGSNDICSTPCLLGSSGDDLCGGACILGDVSAIISSPINWRICHDGSSGRRRAQYHVLDAAEFPLLI